ncbi:hypothetical protein [Prochlorococcus sp. MIT 1307]|uniref:hypothetical protein n=1 Tax=Prochlorococcus sp. MIT 1307 TaxID=3096219 RepID=UPI002A75DF2E|nr:hypothetical protein [Prochlorococcus sp. MIT 1307]
MTKWSEQVEEELALLLKDWLKAQGRTQADLKQSLSAVSTRMPAILEALKIEYSKGGLPNVAERLCIIEADWANEKQTNNEEKATTSNSSHDPFDQLDLLLEEIREDCES